MMVSDIRLNEINSLQSSTACQSGNQPSRIQPGRLEKKRFVILGLFLLCTLTSGFQWIQYTAVGSKITILYNASMPQSVHPDQMILLTSTIYMITYIILVFPATFILNNYGMRISFLLGSSINALGTIVKCIAIDPNRFSLAMIGQTIAATAQIFTLGNPSYIAALWFSERYISTISAIGVFGNQLGIALGFIIPANTMANLTNADDIAYTMKIICYSLAAIETLIFLVALPFFKNAPKEPPSPAQAKLLSSMKLDRNVRSWIRDLRILVTDLNFILLFSTYGTIVGVFYSISTNLYRYYIEYFVDVPSAVGISGLLMILAGIPGSILGGYILDKTGAYKITTIFVCIITLIVHLVFAFVVKIHLIGSYILSFSLGFFMTGFLPIGFEVAAEITYPINEGISSAMLNVAAQIFGILLIVIQDLIIRKWNVFISNIFLAFWLLLGCGCALFIKINYKRSKCKDFNELDRNEYSFERSNTTDVSPSSDDSMEKIVVNNED